MVRHGLRKLSFRWREGFIHVYHGHEGLVVDASNTRITFSERQISVEGLFEGIREYPEGSRGEYKKLYIDLAFPIKGHPHAEGEVYQRSIDTHLAGYGISYTALEGVGYYLTIYPPSGSLYEHAVVADDRVLLYMLSRRQVYHMEERGRHTLILV